ncbi:hypothetical protein BJ085DRAFT_16033, partial [Dimargaris cristalligena]
MTTAVESPASQGPPAPKRSRKALSEAEVRQKKQERSRRNRDAAQQSREKKKQFIADLEVQNGQLQSENGELRARMTDLETQNRALWERLESLTQ